MTKILLIDDDNAYRKVVKIYLKKAGYLITEATDGELALKLCEQNHFDLVLIDMFMPKFDGVSVIFELKNRFRFSKIIAMTGACFCNESIKDILSLATECGASAVYEKTTNMNYLLNTVQNMV